MYGHWIRELPVFKNMPFPERVSQVIRNAPDQPDEKTLDLTRLTEDTIDFSGNIRLKEEQSFTDAVNGLPLSDQLPKL